MLLHDGYVMYHGPPTQLHEYYDDLCMPCPYFCNPVEFYIGIFSQAIIVDRRERVWTIKKLSEVHTSNKRYYDLDYF